MKLDAFIDGFRRASSELKRKEIRKMLARLIRTREAHGWKRGELETIITMEECSELTKAASKMFRFHVGTEVCSDRYNLIEEMADVCLCILYMQELYGIETNDIYKAINVKADRLEGKLEAGIYV